MTPIIKVRRQTIIKELNQICLVSNWISWKARASNQKTAKAESLQKKTNSLMTRNSLKKLCSRMPHKSKRCSSWTWTSRTRESQWTSESNPSSRSFLKGLWYRVREPLPLQNRYTAISKTSETTSRTLTKLLLRIDPTNSPPQNLRIRISLFLLAIKQLKKRRTWFENALPQNLRLLSLTTSKLIFPRISLRRSTPSAILMLHQK